MAKRIPPKKLTPAEKGWVTRRVKEKHEFTLATRVVNKSLPPEVPPKIERESYEP